jgi:hypothetical protein
MSKVPHQGHLRPLEAAISGVFSDLAAGDTTVGSGPTWMPVRRSETTSPGTSRPSRLPVRWPASIPPANRSRYVRPLTTTWGASRWIGTGAARSRVSGRAAKSSAPGCTGLIVSQQLAVGGGDWRGIGGCQRRGGPVRTGSAGDRYESSSGRRPGTNPAHPVAGGRRGAHPRGVGGFGRSPTASGSVGPAADPALVALLIAVAALRRCESRGGHFRTDFPASDAVFRQRHTLTLDTALHAAREIAVRDLRYA